MTETHIKLPNPSIKERESFTTTAYFRAAGAADTPTTVHYRIDDISTKTAITGWTSATPGTSVDITVKASENRIIGQGNSRERRQLVVSADKGTDGETRDTVQWYIENIRGFEE